MSATAAPTHNLHSGTKTRVFTAFGADIDLTKGYQGWSQGKPELPTVWILYLGGDLVVTDMNGDNSTLPAGAAGIPVPGQYKAIVAAGTTATHCIVLWS